jgi:hypothetical protein
MLHAGFAVLLLGGVTYGRLQQSGAMHVRPRRRDLVRKSA